MERTASVEDSDQAMKLGINYLMGLLEWGDYLGPELILDVLTTLHEEWGVDRYRPPPPLRRLVQSGKLGKKNLHGIYRYDSIGGLTGSLIEPIRRVT